VCVCVSICYSSVGCSSQAVTLPILILSLRDPRANVVTAGAMDCRDSSTGILRLASLLNSKWKEMEVPTGNNASRGGGATG
jgi:hypothetical protein